MSDPPSQRPPPVSERVPDRLSDFSLRLQGAGAEPLPRRASQDERATMAQKNVGSTLRGWRLATLLGVGPVTAAYQAHRGTKDAKELAVIKLMIGSAATHERAKSLFLRASYAANRFNHARVLPILEDGTDEKGAPFVVRAWTDAVPLSDLDASALDGKGVLRVAEQVLDALEMAHAHGILHGAITPSNILVTPRGSVRLCDFATPPGLGATRASEENVLHALREDAYTAPERRGQDGLPATESADVYSLGACMYFAIAKAPPPRLNPGATEGPSLRGVAASSAPAVDDHVVAIVAHAMHPDPMRRYESAYAMLGDVRRAMAGRKPKLGDAMAPVPSQSLASGGQGLGGPPSSRRMSSTPAPRDPLLKSGTTASLEERKRREWRGNFVLIVAIALLVGIATFVLIRERVTEDQAAPNGADPD